MCFPEVCIAMASLDRKRIDDLMDELSNLKKSMGSGSNVELRGIWKDFSVDEEELDEAEDSLFEKGR